MSTRSELSVLDILRKLGPKVVPKGHLSAQNKQYFLLLGSFFHQHVVLGIESDAHTSGSNLNTVFGQKVKSCQLATFVGKFDGLWFAST